MFEVSRFIAALFTSGIFWMMVLFFVERKTETRRRSGLKILATVILVASAFLLLDVVVDDARWKTPAVEAETQR
jgi:hypothetical protein